MASKSKPVLGYWDIRGYGQPIRNLLKYLKVDFQEKLYASTENPVSEEWNADKPNLGLDFPNLPYWLDGDLKLSESRAILKHLVREHDPSLFPQDNATWRRADTLDGVFTDIWNILGTACYAPSPDSLASFDSDVPRKLDLISKYIGNDAWILGNKLSYLDFIAYEVLYHVQVYRPNILDNYSNLKEYMRRFEEIPAIAEFMKSPDYIKLPCFSRWASIKI